ncbi:MAG: glycosyltransferase [Pirellulales bacterium]|nr:glycosyltransferase [Pirellulales bacterium]
MPCAPPSPRVAGMPAAAEHIRAAPVNVCFLIDELRTGGTETQLLRLIDNIDRQRVQPHLCLLNGLSDSSRHLEPANVPILRLGVDKLLSRRALGRLRSFRSALRRWRIDVLQVHFPDSTYFGVLAAKLAGVPAVVRTRRDLFYWVTPVHRSWGKRLDQLYNRWFVDAMVVNSEAVKAEAQRAERPAPKRIDVIPNGIDLSRFHHARRSAGSHSKVRIGLVSMLRPEKRVDLFVEAACQVLRRCPHAEFLVAGAGPEQRSIELLIDRLSVSPAVRLLGRTDDIPAFLSELDVAVLCSDTEGQSNAVVEYMAAGLPIVATAVGGNVELLRDGRTALLVPPGDATSLAEAIVKLATDPALRTMLGREARLTMNETFDIRTVARRYESLYRDLELQATRRRRGNR